MVIDGGGVQNVPMTVVRIGTAMHCLGVQHRTEGDCVWNLVQREKDSQKEVEVSDG